MDDKFADIHKRLDPIMDDFVQKADKLGLTVSALIFNGETGLLTRCGNAPAEGIELVRTHYLLSLIAASLEQRGLFKRTSGSGKSLGPTSEELADKLVLACLQVPSTLLPERVLDLAQEYAQSMRPNE